jgi:hypothetical protein
MLSEQFGFGGGGAVFCAVPETEVRYSADVLTHVVEWLATFSYDQPVIWFGRGELLGSGARHAAVEPMKGYVLWRLLLGPQNSQAFCCCS